jgi:omega-amidase
MASSSSSLVPKLRIALCQMAVGVDKAANLSSARAALSSAARLKASLAVLPECWNCPYSTAVFAEYAESVPGVGEVPDELTSECM